MGIATPSPPLVLPSLSHSKLNINTTPSSFIPILIPYYYNSKSFNHTNSMSQEYQHQPNIFSFQNVFDRSQQEQQQQQHQHHLAQQIRRGKLRGLDHPPPVPLVGIEGEEAEVEGEPTGTGLPVYEPAGMLSEMFNFPPPPHPQVGGATGDLLDQSGLHPNYRTQTHPRHHHHHHEQPVAASDWYNRQQQGLVASGLMGPLTNLSEESSKTHHQNDQIPGINADSMQLFLMNPNQRSPSPTPPPNASSTLHMLLPNPPGNSLHFGAPQFSWVNPDTTSEPGGSSSNIEISQGLSLSLSSSLQHLEAAKAEEFRLADHGGFLYGAASSSSSGGNSHHQFYKGLGGFGQHQALHLQGTLMGQSQTQHIHPQGIHAGFGGVGIVPSSSASTSSLGMVNVLRNSKYVKAAQELLEEFCSVGRGHFKRNKLMGRGSNINPSNSNNNNNNSNNNTGGTGSSSTKDLPPLSAAERIEHQRRKVKLLSMLDEVDRRYNHYCEQMQMVVNSFDLVMGFGAAVPYTALAQKAMSRHFRCLKDAIAAQLKHSCELLGEKDASGTSGITKGETPRLKLLEQSLRQQRAFHQMGMMEQEAWRPQRGLPERSVNILRAWLFEHFLHPYPSDADKHLLARQTGLSRNQVSNWFINARVRLWKPMVEEMYQQESKDEDSASEEKQANNPNPSHTATPTTTQSPPPINAHIDNDHSLLARQRFSENQTLPTFPSTTNNTFVIPNSIDTVVPPPFHDFPDDTCHRNSLVEDDYATTATTGTLSTGAPDAIVRFGTTTAGGDVSLTLGLRHAGNMPEKGGSSTSAFSVRDFGGC